MNHSLDGYLSTAATESRTFSEDPDCKLWRSLLPKNESNYELKNCYFTTPAPKDDLIYPHQPVFAAEYRHDETHHSWPWAGKVPWLRSLREKTFLHQACKVRTYLSKMILFYVVDNFCGKRMLYLSYTVVWFISKHKGEHCFYKICMAANKPINKLVEGKYFVNCGRPPGTIFSSYWFFEMSVLKF